MVNANSLGNSSVTSTNFSSPPLNQLLNQITGIKLDRGIPIVENTCSTNFVQLQTKGASVRRKTRSPRFIQSSFGASSSFGTENASEAEPTRSMAKNTTNLQYEQWVTIDQLLLGWLYNSPIDGV